MRGRRDAPIAILLNIVRGMPGCLSYVVAQDSTNLDAITQQRVADWWQRSLCELAEKH